MLTFDHSKEMMDLLNKYYLSSLKEILGSN